MIPTCINLMDRYGRQYRVGCEESHYAEHGPDARVDTPWLMIIPGALGHIFPWSNTLLAVATNKAGAVAKRLRGLPYLVVVQDGDDGINGTFPPEHLPEVAKIIRARRRRRLSEDGRRRLAAAGAKTRFGHGVRAPSEARPCVPEGQDDSEHVLNHLPLFALREAP